MALLMLDTILVGVLTYQGLVQLYEYTKYPSVGKYLWGMSIFAVISMLIVFGVIYNLHYIL